MSRLTGSTGRRPDRVEVGHGEAGQLGQLGHGAVDELEVADGQLALVDAGRALLETALGPVEEGRRAGVLGAVGVGGGRGGAGSGVRR